MFSMPIALLRRELKGPDFFLVGLFPGMIKDCGREKRSSVSQWFKHIDSTSKETLKIIHPVKVRYMLYHLQLRSIISYICVVLQSLWEIKTLFCSLTGRVDVKCVLEGLEMKDGSRISWASLDSCALAGYTLFSSSLSAGILQLLLYDFKWKAFKKGFYLKWLQRLRKDSLLPFSFVFLHY